MTTFTTEDRIIAEKDGSYTLNVEGGMVTASPPHIVDSGASVINNEPVAWIMWVGEQMGYINPSTSKEELDKDLNHFKQFGCNDHKVIPLYIHPVKELTDEEINEIFSKTWLDFQDYKEFARAILRKAQEK